MRLCIYSWPQARCKHAAFSTVFLTEYAFPVPPCFISPKYRALRANTTVLGNSPNLTSSKALPQPSPPAGPCGSLLHMLEPTLANTPAGRCSSENSQVRFYYTSLSTLGLRRQAPTLSLLRSLTLRQQTRGLNREKQRRP